MRPPPPSFERQQCRGHGANGANFFVPWLVKRGTMPLVLKTLKTFFLAKTRNRYHRIHSSVPQCPHTHTHTHTHTDRRPLSKVCALHGLLPCLAAHSCRGAYGTGVPVGTRKVCTPAPARTRPRAPPDGPRKRQCLRCEGPSHYPLRRRPHIPLTPPVTKRGRPRNPPPPIAYSRAP